MSVVLCGSPCAGCSVVVDVVISCSVAFMSLPTTQPYLLGWISTYLSCFSQTPHQSKTNARLQARFYAVARPVPQSHIHIIKKSQNIKTRKGDRTISVRMLIGLVRDADRHAILVTLHDSWLPQAIGPTPRCNQSRTPACPKAIARLSRLVACE